MNLARRAFALAVPCALAALGVLAVLTATQAAEPPAPLPPPPASAVTPAAPGQAALQPGYAACRDQHRPSPAFTAQAARAQAHHRDAASRSQRPTWAQQADSGLERCLREAADTAQAPRGPARYAKQP